MVHANLYLVFTHHGGGHVGGYSLEVLKRRRVGPEHEVDNEVEGAQQDGRSPAGSTQQHVFPIPALPPGPGSIWGGRNATVKGQTFAIEVTKETKRGERKMRRDCEEKEVFL